MAEAVGRLEERFVTLSGRVTERSVASAAAGDRRATVDEDIVSTTRDPRDVKFAGRLILTLIVYSLLMLAQGVGVVYLLLRGNDRVTVVKEGGRIVQVDNVKLGDSSGVRLEKDALTDDDKIFLARNVVGLIQNVDMTKRKSDLKRAYDCMTGWASDGLSKYLSERGINRQQKDEMWDAKWVEQDVSVDPRDRTVVHILGRQEVKRSFEGQPRTDSYQWSVQIQMGVDPRGRQDANFRSGFKVTGIDMKPINELLDRGR